MRIVVCVKHVPDIQSDRSFRDDGVVDREGDSGTLNELDENAIEAALTLVEEHGGEVIALTIGPSDAQDAVRRALQMGADEAVHVLDDEIAGSDALSTARILAAAIGHLNQRAAVDLVITGMAGLDGLTSMVPAALAAYLDLPSLTLAAAVSVNDQTVRIERNVDDAREVIEAELPALVSVTDQTNSPRYPSFKGIMAAKKKPVEQLSLADVAVDTHQVGQAGSGTRVIGAQPRPERTDRIIINADDQAASRLVDYLAERNLI